MTLANRSISMALDEQLLAQLDAQGPKRSALVSQALVLWLAGRRIEGLNKAYGDLARLEGGDLRLPETMPRPWRWTLSFGTAMAEGGQLYCWSRNRSFGDMGALAAAWTEGRLRRLREPCATALPALTSPDANAANLDDRNSGMPTVLRSGPYGIYFYSHDPNEPPHVHVESDQASRKIWLAPVALASSLGFKANELGEVLRLVSAKHTSLLKAWEDFHG